MNEKPVEKWSRLWAEPDVDVVTLLDRAQREGEYLDAIAGLLRNCSTGAGTLSVADTFGQQSEQEQRKDPPDE